MISQEGQWGVAFQKTNKNASAKVPCPKCGKGFLKIDDILDDVGDIYQRGLVCSQCGEKRYLLSAFGCFDEFMKNLMASGDDSVKITETDSSVSIQFDLTKSTDE